MGVKKNWGRGFSSPKGLEFNQKVAADAEAKIEAEQLEFDSLGIFKISRKMKRERRDD